MVPAGATAASTCCATHPRGHCSVPWPVFPRAGGPAGAMGREDAGKHVSAWGHVTAWGHGCRAGGIICRGTHCCKVMALQGTHRCKGTPLWVVYRAKVERGQPSPGKSPAGKKCRKRKNKNSTFPASGRGGLQGFGWAPLARRVAAPVAPSPRQGAGTRLLTLCPAFLALFSFFLLLLHPGDGLSNLSIYG